MIADYVRRAGYSCVVCFSCGNAARALQDAGLEVVNVSPSGDLLPCRWWDAAEVRRVWPGCFDATSGHLPAPLMMEIARAFRAHLGDLSERTYLLPTGSGETLVCLSMVYPDVLFMPVYSDDPATQYHEKAPLNALVYALSGAGFESSVESSFQKSSEAKSGLNG